jgi:hypothetical protein
MKFDDLASSWQETNRADATSSRREELIATTCRRVERLWATVLRRDLVETAAALLGLYFFTGMLWSFEEIVPRLGVAVVIVSLIFVLFSLHRPRLLRPASKIDASVRDFCQVELDRVNDQIALLKSVAWWYVSPILLGVNLVFAGKVGLGLSSLLYLLATLLLGWGIHALNQRAVRKGLIPIRDQIESLRRELEQDTAVSSEAS